ncbi:MAG: TIGR03619 family F420-dependent LLM class oxidoreductase [Thermoplasmata archaeon]|nr:TIGR03619 family F420-dependent LLM class oxidoreductase [Thermoplasmata archaeon]
MVTFGVQIEPQFGYRYDEILDTGRACEELGFTTLHISDHFMLSADAVETDCLECWTVLSGLARDLEKVRIGPLVSSNSYRHPSLLAKMAASVDVLSGGRLEFGLGAGWKEVEYRAYGFRFPSPGERVDRMGEALEILRQMWTEDKASFAGEYYTVEEAVCSPKPVQAGGPPIWVGTAGDRALRYAIRLADGVNVAGLPSLEEFRERMETLRRIAEEEGKDFDGFGRSAFMWGLVAEASQVDEMVSSFARTLGAPVERIRAVGDRGYLGDPEGAVQKFGDFVDAGAQHLILAFARGWERRSMELIRDRVMGQL